MTVIESLMPRRHLPMLNADNRAFWTSGARGELVLTRCQACGLYIHPHGAICRRCQSRNVVPEIVSGRGKVATYTINRHVWEPGLEAPFVVAIVTLEEQPGLNLTTNIVNCAIEDVHIGMPVRVAFTPVEDVWLPVFQPA